MKFLYQDLLNFLSSKPSKEVLSQKLFQLGHEHEINGDIFDMEITPNRGDCLSLNGLARDLNVFFDKIEPFKIYREDISLLNLNFKNLSPEVCPKISFLEIEIESITNSYKPYLEGYFSITGHKKVNFFTDISNYLSYELGQPTHCFDANKIDNKQLIFEDRVCSDSFRTLLDTDINLSDKNSIFSINDEIISLAGVMGGISTSCSPNTNKALVECAYFKPEAIIGKNVKYNLMSDSAHKFERGVDINAQEKVLRRFIEIVKDHVAINDIKIQSFYEDQFKNSKISIDTKRINKILGTDIKEKEYVTYLKKLDFSIEKEIIVPSHRHDIESQNDLAEEIARVIGYDNINNKPLKKLNKFDRNINKVGKLKNFLIKNGFSEVINFPFVAKAEKISISIDNPLDSSKKYLRTSLKNSLLDNLLYNERRQKDSIKFFEISDLYSQNNHEKKIGIIISGRTGYNYRDFSKKLDYSYLINIIKNFFDTSAIKIEEISRAKLKSKKKDKIYYVEISIDDIAEHSFEDQDSRFKEINFIKYKPISEFPSSTKDFSFSITDFKKYDSVINYLSDLNDKNLRDAFIFDFYENKKLSEIKVGVRMIFQSNVCTLSDEEIQTSINRLLKPIINLDGVSIPGLE